jgi:biotin-(acetyl-CoA carboxylase) ligase
MHGHPDPALRASATSVQQALHDWRAASVSASSSPTPLAALSRELLLAHFLHAFESCAGMSATQVQAEYRRYDMLVGRTITVMPKKREDAKSYFDAKAIGYSEEGFLIIENAAGRYEELIAEEVTIRPTKEHK